MRYCEICKEHYFEIDGFGSTRQHNCNPIFECSENGDRSWAKVRAVSHEHAAEKIAEQWDEYDGEGPSENREIQVRKQGEAEVKRFDVRSKVSITYTADEL